MACDGVRRVHRGLRGTPRSCPHQLLDADPLTSGTGTLHPEPYTLHPLPYTFEASAHYARAFEWTVGPYAIP